MEGNAALEVAQIPLVSFPTIRMAHIRMFLNYVAKPSIAERGCQKLIPHASGTGAPPRRVPAGQQPPGQKEQIAEGKRERRLAVGHEPDGRPAEAPDQGEEGGLGLDPRPLPDTPPQLGQRPRGQ